MSTAAFLHPVSDQNLAPFLFWNPVTHSGHGAPLACPQCAGPHLHLGAIYFAAPVNTQYTPETGLTIDPETAVVLPNDEARMLHAGQNRGPMLAIRYWCENSCEGRIELRVHKGHLFASLHHQPHMPADDPGGP